MNSDESPTWRPIAEPPSAPCGVLLWFPTEAHAHTVHGEDYTIQIGRWSGERFLEQGTNHDILLDLLGGNEEFAPTLWMMLPARPDAEQQQGGRKDGSSLTGNQTRDGRIGDGP